jgi:hypothetical protein
MWGHLTTTQPNAWFSERRRETTRKDERTRSLMTFITHSPPLLPGLSRIMPTNASSEHTRKTGRCLERRAASSFSRCSGAIADSAAREGGASTAARDETTAGVKAVGKRLCSIDRTCARASTVERGGRDTRRFAGDAPRPRSIHLFPFCISLRPRKRQPRSHQRTFRARGIQCP